VGLGGGCCQINNSYLFLFGIIFYVLSAFQTATLAFMYLLFVVISKLKVHTVPQQSYAHFLLSASVSLFPLKIKSK